MEDILVLWGGDERGSRSGPAQDFPLCIPVGSQAAHAAGVAYAFKYRKQARVAVCILGDGATSKGDVWEAMNFAGIWKLPLVFLINNNQWAISVPLKRQTASQTLAQKAIAAGFSGEQVDGNDLIAVRAAADAAIAAARAGEGARLTVRAGQASASALARSRDPAPTGDITRFFHIFSVCEDNSGRKKPHKTLKISGRKDGRDGGNPPQIVGT
jgi:pyruvate dehydrogenase E1 component alpha subunit